MHLIKATQYATSSSSNDKVFVFVSVFGHLYLYLYLARAAGGGGAFNKGNAITPRHRHPSVCTLSQLDTKKYCQTSLFKNWHTRSFLDSKQRTAFNKGNAITSRHRHQSICTLSQLETASRKNTSTAKHISSKTSFSFLDSTYSTNLRSVFHILWNG